VLDNIKAFFDIVGGILSLDPEAILGVQTAPDGLTVAIVILVLATAADVVGDSPLLFMKKMRPGRLTAALGVETVLSLVRLAIWMGSLWMLLFVLNRGAVELANVVLVIGIGYAPMLWSFLVVIPTIGPLIGRILIAWTLVTITASIAVASNTSPLEALAAPVVAVLVILLVRRSSNHVSLALLGRVSRQLTGVDLMQRTRAMDPLVVMAERADG
jgi:hypothetical protein